MLLPSERIIFGLMMILGFCCAGRRLFPGAVVSSRGRSSQLVDLIVGIDDQNSLENTDLIGSQPDARRVVHGFEHVVGELEKGLLDSAIGCAFLGKYGVREK